MEDILFSGPGRLFETIDFNATTNYSTLIKKFENKLFLMNSRKEIKKQTSPRRRIERKKIKTKFKSKKHVYQAYKYESIQVRCKNIIKKLTRIKITTYMKT